MASYVRNIHTENYENLLIFIQVKIENVRDVFWDSEMRNLKALLTELLIALCLKAKWKLNDVGVILKYASQLKIAKEIIY